LLVEEAEKIRYINLNNKALVAANKMRLHKLFDTKKHLYNHHNQQKSLLVKETQKMMIVGKVFISNIVILNKLTDKNDH
jgi:hypothetical protein